MRTEVTQAVEELKRQFSGGPVTVLEDGQGGAYVIVEAVAIGSRFRPEKTWMGAQITAQYPYADIYPVFIGADVVRADGAPFVAPISPNPNFQGRPALQISRKNNAIGSGPQTAVAKFLKILDFLERLP
jgi:hypothetical protein